MNEKKEPKEVTHCCSLLSKYRGKRKDNERWIYGSLNIEFDGTCHICFWVSELLEPENNYYENVHKMSEVLPETVGVFIGMTDNDEKDIYSGDILKCYDSAALDKDWGLDKQHIGIIEYTAPCFSLKIPGKLDYDGGAVKHWSNDIYLDKWCNAENIEKLGNIFDNPELLQAL